MSRPVEESATTFGQRTHSPPDSSLDDLELESCIEDLNNLENIDSGGLTRKPHFLDYDNKPPAELVEQHNRLNGTSPSAETEQNDTPRVCETYQTPLVAAVPAALQIRPSQGTWPLKERANSARRQQHHHHHHHHSLNRELPEVGPKMECVYSLLSMLGSTNVLEMSNKFLELSRNEEKCSALRRSGCVPLLVHIIHNEPNDVARRNARHALVNVIRCNVDEAAARRELKVLRLIDQLIDYSDVLKEQHAAGEPEATENVSTERQTAQEQERHPIQAIGTLVKISYDEEHRHAMCQFGALQTISTLIQLDHLVHGASPDGPKCIEMRRYASMVLTNLTFGQGNNKALLCSNREFMQTLVSQLGCVELLQVTASVLRNLSWRADSVTKQTLIEIGTVKILTESAMRCTVENTLKSILSALWNLSNHCTQNRANICEVEGALEFLVDMLTYDAPSKTMSIIENAGGILRNISSHIAQCEQYRRVLREKNCLKILLDQLKSPSLTVVSNACGTLGNISSDNGEDQQFLRDNGAIPMLRSLIYSKHNIISSGSRLALKNLQPRAPTAGAPELLGQPSGEAQLKPSAGKAADPKELPCLNVRKQRAMEEELGSAFYQVAKEDDPREEETSDEERLVVPCGKKPDPPSAHKAQAGVVTHKAHKVTTEDDGLETAETEQLINYSLQDDLHHEQHQQQQVSYDYQETDIDQLTNYSLRYAENQSDSDEEKEGEAYSADPVNMLIPEDSVKCYYTEGTPQIISSATSMSDLRVAAAASQSHAQPSPFKQQHQQQQQQQHQHQHRQQQLHAVKTNPIPIVGGASVTSAELGCNTPDRPYNYCEEGTPDFSRDASLSIIDLSDDGGKERAGEPKPEPPVASVVDLAEVTVDLPGGPAAKSVSFVNTAEETPLMFSRTSSLGSLSSAEPTCTDDKSSIVSEFSRMASGVMSPSELPDSPTQTIAHSPRRSDEASLTSASMCDVRAHTKNAVPRSQVQQLQVQAQKLEEDEQQQQQQQQQQQEQQQQSQQQQQPQQQQQQQPQQQQPQQQQIPATRARPVVRQPSAFEDTVSKFNVENTPAQFSCATSLSNLSIEDKEPEGEQESTVVAMVATAVTSELTDEPICSSGNSANDSVLEPGHQPDESSTIISDGDSDAGGDDELLASCISIGMNSVKARSSSAKEGSSSSSNGAVAYANLPVAKPAPADAPELLSRNEMLMRYCAKGIGARHVSGATSTGELSEATMMEDGSAERAELAERAVSDDSSNESDNNNDRLLEECILSGMPKPKTGTFLGGGAGSKQQALRHGGLAGPVEKENPFKMMRNPVHLQPLLANDELSPFHVEDSPCNFSTISALSELTVASDASPAQTMRLRMDRSSLASAPEHANGTSPEVNNDNRSTVSSPSVPSDEDDHLLEEAIATGAIRKAEMAQHRRRTMLEQQQQQQQTPLPHVDINRLTSPGAGSAGSTETANSDDEQEEEEELLKDAIERGMKKGQKGEPAAAAAAATATSSSTTTTTTGADTERWVSIARHSLDKPTESIQDSDRDDDDYQLLAECIQRGMHTVPKGPALVGGASKQGGRATVPPVAGTVQTSSPKNVHTTPVIPKVVGAAAVSAGVVSSASYQPQSTGTRASPSSAMRPPAPGPGSIGAKAIEATSTAHRHMLRSRSHSTAAATPSSSADGPASCGRVTPEGGAAQPAPATASASGYDPLPAATTTAPTNTTTTDKHKDPEQMLKSVERLTRELVSQRVHDKSPPAEPAAAANGQPPVISFQLGGQVSASQLSLKFDESDSLMEFVYLPNVELPSLMNVDVDDDELLGTSLHTVLPPARTTQYGFLPPFSVIGDMANISSIEPPTLLNESLGSLGSSAAKWCDEGGGPVEAVGSLSKIISNFSQVAGTRCHTPPSAAESAELAQPAVEPAAPTEAPAPQPAQSLNQLLAPTSDGKSVESPSAKSGASDAAKLPAKERLQLLQQRMSVTKLPQQRKASLPADTHKPPAKKTPPAPGGGSPFGGRMVAVGGLSASTRTPHKPANQVVRTASASGIAIPPSARKGKDVAAGASTPSAHSEPLRQTKDAFLMKRTPATVPRFAPASAGIKAPAAAAAEASAGKQLPPKSASRTPRLLANGSRLTSPNNTTNTTTSIKNSGVVATKESPKQPKGSPKTGSPATTQLTRQQTFVNDKPSMAALPHISSAPSSPAKVRKAGGPGDGSKAPRPETLLTRANTTLKKRVANSGTGGGATAAAAVNAAPRFSRIPPPSARLPAVSFPPGLLSARSKERSAATSAGHHEIPQHLH